MDESKLAPNLLAKLREPHALDVDVPPIPVIVRYRPDVVRSRTVKEGLEARFVYRLTPTVALAAPGREVMALTDVEEIEYIWLDEPVHICLDRSVPAIGVPEVWAAGYRGAGVKVAIVDTGIDPDHPDLAGRVAGGESFVGGDYRDENGHGTHVAGIIAGSGAASGGRYRGVAPEATLYVARVLDRDGSGAMSGVMAGVEWAVDQGVQVINLSLGGAGSSDGQDALSLTCNAAVAQGIVVCVAAGNAGPGAKTIGAPGAAADVITVGAVDRQDAVARFSARGPTADGRDKPDVCFPGVGIVSTRAAGLSPGEPVDEHYTAISGTSMATPHASGVAALLLQAVPTLTPAEVKRALMDTALDLGEARTAQGTGRARAALAFKAVKGETPPPPTPGPGPEPKPPVTKKGCLPDFLIPLIGS